MYIILTVMVANVVLIYTLFLLVPGIFRTLRALRVSMYKSKKTPSLETIPPNPINLKTNHQIQPVRVGSSQKIKLCLKQKSNYIKPLSLKIQNAKPGTTWHRTMFLFLLDRKVGQTVEL